MTKLLLLLAFASFAAHAANCDSPPFGDTEKNYEAMASAFARASRAVPGLPPDLLTKQMIFTLTQACQAKFNGGDRSMFQKEGLSDKDIDSLTSTELAHAWFQSRNKALEQEKTPDCSRPPYGDTVARFKSFTAK